MMRSSERLRDARLLVGVTQEELALSSGVSQATISMIERGERSFSDDNIASFASSLALPVEFFEVPTSSIPDSAIDFRKLKSASVKDTNRAKVLFKEAHRAATTLMEAATYPVATVPFEQERDYPLSTSQIEEIATETRKQLQIDTGAPITNVIRALERRGVAVTPLIVPNAEEDVTASVQHFGASHWAGIDAHAVVGYFPGSSGDRDRFTMSHELGHLVLHTFRQHVPSDVRETEANAFASAFLFPLDRAAEALGSHTKLKNLAELKAQWGISMQAIIMRAKRAELITDSHATSLFKQISARGWRKAEPVHVPHETPALIRALIEKHFGANPFSSARIEKELALPAVIIRSFAPGLSLTETSQTRNNVVHGRFGQNR